MPNDRQTVRQIEVAEHIRPVQSQMELNVGRFDPPRAGQSLLLAVGVLAISTAGAGLVRATVGATDGMLLFLMWFGVQIILISESVGMIIIWITVQEWRSYQRRLQEWHEVTICAVERAGGVEHTTSYTATELSSTSLRDVLLLALLVHRNQGQRKAHTLTALEGEHWLTSSNGNQHRIGDVRPGEAERIGALFAALGLVEGRDKRRAGQWVPGSEGQVIDLIEQNWHKVH